MGQHKAQLADILTKDMPAPPIRNKFLLRGIVSLVLTAKEEAVEEKASTQRREQRQRAKERKKVRIAEFEESQKRVGETASSHPSKEAQSEDSVAELGTEVNELINSCTLGTYTNQPRTIRKIRFATTPSYCYSV